MSSEPEYRLMEDRRFEMLYGKYQCPICLAYPVNMIAHSMVDLTATSTFLSFSVLLIAHEETTE